MSSPSETFSYQEIPDYLNSIDENTALNEVIDFLFSVREVIVGEGYSVPIFSEMFVVLLEEISAQPGIELDEAFVETFYEEIISREEKLCELTSFDSLKNLEKANIFLVKSRGSKKNEIKISSGFAKGFCKTFGGALLCVIPHPVTWGIGGGLVVSGVADMIQHADDSDGITMEELDRQLRERQRIGIENLSLSPRIDLIEKSKRQQFI